jgi:hypothetical protein
MKQPAGKILVPDVYERPSQISEKDQSPIGTFAAAASPHCSLSVDTPLPTRTTASWGITGPELNRLSGAVTVMNRQAIEGRGRLFFLSTAPHMTRSTIAYIGKQITRLQAEHKLPPYHVTVFEASGGLHAHNVFIGNKEIVRRLQGSALFGEHIKIKIVTDHEGLARRYLAKERTSQAGYRRKYMLGGRIKGSHRLEGGGDRVRLSRGLERDAVDAGYVEPWQHTNARRSAERKPYRLRRLFSHKAPRLAGQIPLPFDEIRRPVARLREFGGGFVPAAVAREIEFRRRQRGLSQAQLGRMIGRCQGQIANVLRGHDPISAAATHRLRAILL